MKERAESGGRVDRHAVEDMVDMTLNRIVDDLIEARNRWGEENGVPPERVGVDWNQIADALRERVEALARRHAQGERLGTLSGLLYLAGNALLAAYCFDQWEIPNENQEQTIERIAELFRTARAGMAAEMEA